MFKNWILPNAFCYMSENHSATLGLCVWIQSTPDLWFARQKLVENILHWARFSWILAVHLLLVKYVLDQGWLYNPVPVPCARVQMTKYCSLLHASLLLFVDKSWSSPFKLYTDARYSCNLCTLRGLIRICETVAVFDPAEILERLECWFARQLITCLSFYLWVHFRS